MSDNLSTAILLLDESLGSLRNVSEDKSTGLAGIDVSPASAKALQELKQAGIQMVLAIFERLPERSQQILQQSLPQIDHVVTLEHNLQDTVSSCAKQLSIDLDQTIVVAADRFWRGVAADQGCFAVSHPAIASLFARGCCLQFVRAIGERESFKRLPEVVPYFWERAGDSTWSLLAVMSRASIAEAIRRRVRVDVLPLDISKEDPLFVQTADIDEHAKEELTRQKVLFSDGQKILLAVGPSQFNDSFEFHGTHGLFQHLMPNPELWQPTKYSSLGVEEARLALRKWPMEKFKVTRIQIDPEILGPVLTLCPSTPASFQADVDRYRGGAGLDSSGSIVSRHIRHPDNQRVVDALLNELNAMGYCSYVHSFNHAGITLRNVIADLPGTGYFRIDPNILKRIREIFLRYPLPEPPDPWIKSITRLLGSEWLKVQNFEGLSPLKLRNALENMFELKPWLPWWLKACPLAGLGAKVIIVGCHLDSTAAGTPGYNPLTDSAPGADDNASGIAATLAMARYFSNFRGKLTHTVRFCFFNAEEQGLVGSKSYAAMLKAAGAPIKAVVCTDMIGYNSDAQHIFEIHAGY